MPQFKRRRTVQQKKALSTARPRVDVVLPYTADYLRWLPQCVESLRAQIDVAVTIHLIADGVSEWDDVARCRYSGVDGIRLYASADQAGPYVQANRVAGRLQGAFLAIADADDWYYPDRLVHQVGRLESEPADVIGSALVNFPDPDEPAPPDRRWHSHRDALCTSGTITGPLCPGGNVINPTMTLRLATFLESGGFANWAFGADWEFTGRVEAAGWTLLREQRTVGARRIHGLQLTRREKTGVDSPARRERNAEIARRLRAYADGSADPRDYGGLRDCRPERTVRVW